MKKEKTNKYEKGVIIVGIIIAIIMLIFITADGIKNSNQKEKTAEQPQAQYQYTTKIGSVEYPIDNAVTSTPNVPVTSAGMIPIKWNGTDWEIAENDNTWYNYEEGKPAYIMLNDGVYQSELAVDMTGKKLSKENIGQEVETAELGSIYMWVPRFIYNEEGEILYIKQGHRVEGSWTTPDVFMYETAKADFSLSGIWVEYKTSTAATKVTSMNQENNKYGLIANTKSCEMEEKDRVGVQKYVTYIGQKNNAEKPNPAIIAMTNANRTVLKIVNADKKEAIRGRAYYDTTVEKIKIEVTYNKNGGVSKIVDEAGKVLSENSLTADTGDTIIGNSTYKFIIIDKEGIQKEVQVTVTGLDVYIIKDANTLYVFRDAVNAGLTTAKTRAYQVANVTIPSGVAWTPIANYATNNKLTYAGTYDGQGHTVSGINVNYAVVNGVGFFGTVSGTVKNVGIINSTIKNTNSTTGNNRHNAGGLIARLENGGRVDSCYSAATVSTAADYCGGIVGYSDTTSAVSITNCYNIGTVSGKSDVGGIVGYKVGAGSLTITNCYNRGNVSGSDCYVGGIIGYKKDCTLTVNNCYNSGTINGADSTGGILGITYSSGSATIKNCYNTGNVTGSGTTGVATTMGAGGIVGNAHSGATITYCYNSGTITKKSSNMTGGIVGNYGTISSCYNTGIVSGKGYVGGISGKDSTGIINYCYNEGAITGTDSYVGGIAGTNPSAIQNTYNKGNITGTDYVGGITGMAGSSKTTGTSVTNSYNLGPKVIATSASSYVGGIVGHLSNGGSLEYCYNISNVNGNKWVGGITGNASYSASATSRSHVSYSYNLGIIGNSSSTHVGGIAGDSCSSSGYTGVKYCTNTGAVYGSTDNNKGALVGYASSSSYTGLSDCSYLEGTATYAAGRAKANGGATSFTSSNIPAVISRVGTSAYRTDTSINANYPVLKWQTNNDRLNLINGDDAFKQLEDGSIVLAWQ